MQFCDDGMWDRIVANTQGPIIDGNYLKTFADTCRERFDEESKAIYYQAISQDALNVPFAEKVCSIRSGYDMPVSFQEERQPRYIALVFQDPLRSPDAPNTLSIGVPFGLSELHMRRRKRYKFVWELIKKITNYGYGVWVTDANKLWFDPQVKKNIFSKSELKTLGELQLSVLQDEMKQVMPILTIAFGKKAQGSLDRCGISYEAHPHPSVYGGKPLEAVYGLKKGQFDYESRLDAAWEKIKRDIDSV